jgi:hypothetical protein
MTLAGIGALAWALSGGGVLADPGLAARVDAAVAAKREAAVGDRQALS